MHYFSCTPGGKGAPAGLLRKFTLSKMSESEPLTTCSDFSKFLLTGEGICGKYNKKMVGELAG
jgi:hypothetical protein